MPAALSRRVEGVRLYAPNLRSLSLRSPGDYFLTTDTPNVMRWLADRMRAAGVELRLMQSFTDAHRVRGGWQVEGLGRTHWLVGADGAKSQIGRASGRESVGQYVLITVVAGPIKKKQKNN